MLAGYRDLAVDFYDACPDWWDAARATLAAQPAAVREIFESLVDCGRAIGTDQEVAAFERWAMALDGWTGAEGEHPVLIGEAK